MGIFDNIVSSLKTGIKNTSNTIKAPLDTAHRRGAGKFNPQRNINRALSKLNPKNFLDDKKRR